MRLFYDSLNKARRKKKIKCAKLILKKAVSLSVQVSKLFHINFIIEMIN